MFADDEQAQSGGSGGSDGGSSGGDDTSSPLPPRELDQHTAGLDPSRFQTRVNPPSEHKDD